MDRIIEKRIKVTDGDIEDILGAAFQGITYWADEAEIVGKLRPEDEGIYTSEALTHCYKIRIHDAEGEKNHYLTLTRFLKGLAQMKHHDFYEYDMYDGDAVIQYALFGKQVYA